MALPLSAAAQEKPEVIWFEVLDKDKFSEDDHLCSFALPYGQYLQFIMFRPVSTHAEI